MAEEYDGKQKVKSMLAGGFGGICVVLSGHPFDTVKVSYFFPILKKAYFFFSVEIYLPCLLVTMTSRFFFAHRPI